MTDTDVDGWDDVRDEFADKARPNFVNQVRTALGVEEEAAHLGTETFRSLTKDEYQPTLEALGAVDGVELKYESDSPWTDVPVAAKVHDALFEGELDTLTELAVDEKQFFPEEYEDIVAEISYDLSNEFEKATGVGNDLAAAHVERRLIDTLMLDAIPEDTGLYRVGHVPGFMRPDVDDFYDRQRFENEDGYPSKEQWEQFMTQKRRYIDHLDSHGADVMSIGGTDSIQVTMRPSMPEETSAFMDPVDQMFADFYGHGSQASMMAISPILYAPFMNSPVYEETEDGGLELVHQMGREWAYGNGLDDSPYADADKYGFVEALADVESVEDAIDAFAGKRFQFSAEVDASELEVVGEDESLATAYGDDHEQIDPETGVNVRVGHEDYGVIDFKDFIDDRSFEGQVSLPAEDGEGDKVTVRADYSDQSDEAFLETVWGHFQAHASGVWPNYNPRFDAGAVESRDYGDSPRITEAVDTQAAAFLKWEEIQSYAEETLEMHDAYAEIVRDGTGREGLDFVLPSGHTVEEAWYGPEDEQGLLDILEDGVREAAVNNGGGPMEEAAAAEYAARYRDQMETYLDDGTYAEVFTETMKEDGFGAAMEETRIEAPDFTNGYDG